MRFGQQLLAAGALLPAIVFAVPSPNATPAPVMIELGPAFDMPEFDLGAPAGASTVKVDVGEAAVNNLYCNLQPARLCALSDGEGAYNYLNGLGGGSALCGITAPMYAQTGVQLARVGSASVVLATQKPGNITMACSTAADLLDEILMSCQNANGMRVKGLIQVPASNYTAEGFAPDAHSVSILIRHH